MIGIIIKALSGFYYVECESLVYECKARGNFRKNGIAPLVGEKVEFEIIDEKYGVIDTVLQRKNVLKRPNIANIDKLFIVSSYSTPAPNSYIIDKITAIAEYNNIEPIIVFNKSDMGDFSDWQRIYNNAGFKTCVVSAASGEGMQALIEELTDCVSAFTGNSGVGKSSILNFLLGDDIIATGSVSEKLGRGRHTTRHNQAYKLSFGGFVIDTPGFSALEYDSSDYNFKENLPHYFRDFENVIYDCKFSSCTHTKENGCAVINAVKNGDIEETRHNSYIQLFEELKDLKPWEAANSKKK